MSITDKLIFTISESCKDGWSNFENACYKIVDDFNYECDDIDTCRYLVRSVLQQSYSSTPGLSVSRPGGTYPVSTASMRMPLFTVSSGQTMGRHCN